MRLARFGVNELERRLKVSLIENETLKSDDKLSRAFLDKSMARQ
jgi:hypothetical protein